jgi:hypothetical protein
MSSHQVNYPLYEDLPVNIESFMIYFQTINLKFSEFISFLNLNYPKQLHEIKKKEIFSYLSKNEIYGGRYLNEKYGIVIDKSNKKVNTKGFKFNLYEKLCNKTKLKSFFTNQKIIQDLNNYSFKILQECVKYSFEEVNEELIFLLEFMKFKYMDERFYDLFTTKSQFQNFNINLYNFFFELKRDEFPEIEKVRNNIFHSFFNINKTKIQDLFKTETFLEELKKIEKYPEVMEKIQEIFLGNKLLELVFEFMINKNIEIFENLTKIELINLNILLYKILGYISDYELKVKASLNDIKKKKNDFANNCFMDVCIVREEDKKIIKSNLMIFFDSIKIVGCSSLQEVIQVFEIFFNQIIKKQKNKNWIYKPDAETENIKVVIEKVMRNHCFCFGLPINKNELHRVCNDPKYDSYISLSFNEQATKTTNLLHFICEPFFDVYGLNLSNKKFDRHYEVLDNKVCYKKNKKNKKLKITFTIHESSKINMSGRSILSNKIAYERFIKIIQDNEQDIFL